MEYGEEALSNYWHFCSVDEWITKLLLILYPIDDIVRTAWLNTRKFPFN